MLQHISGVQAASWFAGLISACYWAFSTEYESVILIKGLVLQLQSRLRCRLASTKCYDLEVVQDTIICEVHARGVHELISLCQVPCSCELKRTTDAAAACDNHRRILLPCFQDDRAA